MKPLASSLLPCHAWPLKLYAARSIIWMTWCSDRESNGIRPLRSMYAMTPTDHMSVAFVYSALSTSGAMLTSAQSTREMQNTRGGEG